MDGVKYRNRVQLMSLQAMQVPRPKLELAVPYKHYKLVSAGGHCIERQDKHPFCMSRVFYNKGEMPEEVWAEDAAATYRWRQTGSEIKVAVLKVRKKVHLAKHVLHYFIGTQFQICVASNYY